MNVVVSHVDDSTRVRLYVVFLSFCQTSVDQARQVEKST